MEDPEAKDTYIKDSNVEILIANSSSGLTSGGRPKTDYTSMIVIAVIMVSFVVYILYTRAHAPS